MNVRRERIGEMPCVVTELPAGATPELVVVFCHGFGAPGTDLVPLAEQLVQLEPQLEGVQFLFPAAPLDLSEMGLYGGRAWWPLDIARMQRAIELGEFRNMRDESPELLPEARRLLVDMIQALQTRYGLPLSRFVLGGFSQGSMIATDVALRLPEAVGGLLIYSGTLLCESEWRPLAAQRAGLKVIQSHGTADAILPFQAAEWLRDFLTDAGLDVRFLPFRGPHTISFEAIEETAKLLRRLMPGGD